MGEEQKMSLKEALGALLSAQARYKQAEAYAKEQKAEYDRLSIEVLPELMAAEGLSSVTRGDTVIYTREDMFANVEAAERGALAAELREIGHGDLITEYVFPQTLTAWAKAQLEAGEPLPPQVSLRTVKRAVPRKK